jgi:hypothetical protein
LDLGQAFADVQCPRFQEDKFARADAIRLEPTSNNRHFVFKNINISGGTRALYATNAAGGGTIEQQSVFENLYFIGAAAEGLFFDTMQAIGCHFRRLKAENCGSHGIRFSGQATLNGSQVESCRRVNNRGHGFLPTGVLQVPASHSTATSPRVSCGATRIAQ